MREPTPIRPAATAYTLIEMVAALAIVSVLMLGVASAMLVASRSVAPHTRPRATHTAAEAAARVVRELEFATAFTNRAADAVTFTVADRNGDGAEETIRYAWSGTAGDPLIRQVNGGAAVAVIDDVRECNLAFNLRSVEEEPDASGNESAEQTLTGWGSAMLPQDFAIREYHWVAQYIMPSLPADTVSWSVTRVLIKARRHGPAHGVTAVQLRLVDASKRPTDIILEEVPMYEDRLTDGYLWHQFRFSNAQALSPSRGLCLVLACLRDDADLADVQYDDKGMGGLLRSWDGGASWSGDVIKSLLFSVRGTYTTSNEADTVTRTWVRGVEIRLRAGPDPHTAVETGVRILNAPEVTD